MYNIFWRFNRQEISVVLAKYNSVFKVIFIFNISRVTIFTNSFPYIYVILSSAVFQISSGIRGRPAKKGSGSNRMEKVPSSKSRRSAKVQIEGAIYNISRLNYCQNLGSATVACMRNCVNASQLFTGLIHLSYL